MKVCDPVSLILRKKGCDIWSVPSDTTVYDAMRTMADKEVGALLVVDDGHLHGIVSERDYARKVILQGKSSKHTLVRDIMSSPVVFVTPDTTVDECMRIMTDPVFTFFCFLSDIGFFWVRVYDNTVIDETASAPCVDQMFSHLRITRTPAIEPILLYVHTLPSLAVHDSHSLLFEYSTTHHSS